MNASTTRGSWVRRARSRGQATIEFALVLPLFLLLFLGMLEIGWAWIAVSQVDQAAKEGAEFIRRQVPAFTPLMPVQANAIAQNFAGRFAGRGGVLFAATTVQPVGANNESLVKVEVRLQYPLITGPFLRYFRIKGFPAIGAGGVIVITRSSYALTDPGSS